MAGVLQPLGKEFPIVGEDGRPTEYFIRWAQQRQIDIGEGITAAEALQIVTDYVNQFTTDHQLQEGVGIDIAPSGDLKDNPTISLDAVLDDLNDVDTVTTPPTDGQALIWNDADDLWVPGDVASGGGGGGGALHKIAEFIAVGGETEYVFSGIPQTYDDLVVVTSLRSTGGTGETSSRVHINGDTGTNYGRQRGNFSAGSATAAATDETFAWIGYATGSTGLAGGFDQGSVQFVNYADSVNHKGWLAHSMSKAASSGAYSEILLAGQWENTAPITSLRFHLETGNYAAGSKIIVYGRGGVAGPPVGGALQKIAQFVAIGGETTYTFSSLPQTYDDLVIIHNARGDTAANDTQLDMRFNGDTGSNYNYQQLFANGTATSAVRNNSSSLLRINQFAAASSTANVFTGGVTEVYAYANNVAFKSATGYGGNFDGANIRSVTGSGQWRDTDAITSITVFPGAGAFVAGSVITVYGRGGPAGAVEGVEVQDEGVVTDPNALVLNFKGTASVSSVSAGIVDIDIPAVAKAGDTMTGQLFIATTATTPANIYLRAPAANVAANLHFQVGSSARWSFAKTNTAETGGNAGSDFAISRYTDAGVFIATALQIARQTGVVKFNGPVELPSHLRTALPSASVAGQTIYVSDAVGGACMAFSNGTNWISVITGTAV